MGKASLTISIGGDYNGKALAKAAADLRKLNVESARHATGIAQNFVSAGDRMVDLGNNMQYTGEKISAAGMKITKLTAPIAAVGAASVKLAADYENSVAKVYTIMDKGVMSTQDMSRAILDLSTETGKSATELAEATYQALSASVATDKAAGFVSDAVKLAKVGFTDTTSAVDVLTTTINAYGMSADDAAMITGRLVQTQNKGKTTVNELASSLGNVIPTAAALNVNLDNVSSAYVVMTKRGIRTADATTALRGLLSELSNEGSTVAGVLKEKTGKSFGELMADGMNLGEVIQILSDSVDGNSEKFKNLWGNVRASTGALSIAQAGVGEFNTAMNDMADSAGLVDSALEDLATPSAKANKAINAVKNIAIDLGEQIIGAAVPALEDLAGKAKALYSWFRDLDDGTKQVIVKYGALVVAAGPVITMFGKMYSGVGKLISGFGHGLQSVGAFAGAMKTAGAEMKKAGAESVTFGQKLSGAAKQTGMLTSATNLLKGSLAMIGIAAAVAAVGMIVKAYTDWKKHTELVENATTGLETAVQAAGAAYDDYIPSVEAAASSNQSLAKSAQECLEAQASLADKQREAWREIGTNSAVVDGYAQTIADLTAKEELNEDEQARLVAAVRGFNDETGASIGIVNARTGELNMQRDAILECAEAYKTEARTQALREMYAETARQSAEAEIALKQAKQDLEAAQTALNNAEFDGVTDMSQYTARVEAQQKKVDELQAMYDSAQNTLDTYLQMMSEGTATFSSFDDALAASGVSLEALGTISDAELNGMRDNFDGSLNYILDICASKGVRIPEQLANGIKSSSGLPEAEQQAMLDAMVLQLTGGDVAAAAELLGHDIDAGLEAGIVGSSALPPAAIGIMSQETIDAAMEAFESHSPSQVMFRLGEDIDAGLGDGIDSNGDRPKGAMESISTLVQGAVKGLPDFAKGIGSSSGQGMANTLNGKAGAVYGGALSLFGSAQSGISGTPGAFSSTGQSSASGFAGAIGGASAYWQGHLLANTAKNGLGSVSAHGAGSNFASGFANGMGSVNIWSAAYNVGMSALNAIKSALGIASPSKETTKVGEWFGQGAVIGMRNTERSILAETKRLDDIMTLEPTVNGAFSMLPAQGYQAVRELPRAPRLSGQAGEDGMVVYLTANIHLNEAAQAEQAGEQLADGLYRQWRRYARAL